MSNKGQTGLMISWTRHGRSTALAQALSLEDVVIGGGGTILPLRYAIQFVQTVRIILRRTPRQIVFMQPPAPLALAAVWAGKIVGTQSVVGDLHSGYFNDVKWKWFAKVGLRLLRRDAVIVTNSSLARLASERTRTFVLHDVLRVNYSDDPTTRQRSNLVLVPLSYAPDEPIDVIFQAAQAIPSLTWVLTGKPPEPVRRQAPPNVEFSGFVPAAEFERMLHSARAVLALTTRGDTMQRAAYESLMAGTPIVTSNFQVLTEFFGEAASYASANAQSLVEATNEALSGSTSQALESVLNMRIEEQQATLEDLRSHLKVGTAA